MSESPAQRRYTIAEYLDLETASVSRHEYHDGLIVAMAGGSPRHALVIANAMGAIGSALKGKPCRAYSSDLKVYSPHNRSFVYPDISVVCGPLEHGPATRDQGSVTNPTLTVEVLSPATEGYDRGRKFAGYRALGSFREYVLVSTDEPRIETCFREDDGRWVMGFVEGLQAAITLRSVGITLSLAVVSAGVEFETPLPPPLG